MPRSPIETLKNIQPNICDHSGATEDGVPSSSHPNENSPPSSTTPDQKGSTSSRSEATETITLGPTRHSSRYFFLLFLPIRKRSVSHCLSGLTLSHTSSSSESFGSKNISVLSSSSLTTSSLTGDGNSHVKHLVYILVPSL